MPTSAVLSPTAYRADQILIQFGGSTTAAEHSRAFEAIGGRLLDIISGSDGPNGDLARVGLGQGVTVEKAIAILSHLPGVTFAEPDYVVSAQALSNDTLVAGGSTWGLYGDIGVPANLYGSQASEAWAAGYVGSAKTAVGVMDTGIDYTHPDLYLNVWLNQTEVPLSFRASLTDTNGDGLITFRDLNQVANANFVSDLNGNGRIDAGDLLKDIRWSNGVDEDGNGYKDDLIGWDFVNNDNDPMDDQGHGTHVSGTIGAVGGNGLGVAGIAWTTQIVGLKFMDATGYGYTSNAIRAADYFTNASKVGSAIDFTATNNSWGGASYSQAMLDAITRGAKQDILFVGSAGNAGANNDLTPYYVSGYSTEAGAGYDAVLAVAAIGSNGALASWSSFGATTVDLAAPGVGIYSTTLGGGYGAMSGTSMATPHVTGAIALYSAAHPDATAAEIRAALLASTTTTASVLGKVATDGRLDVAHFLETVVSLPSGEPAPAPAPAPEPAPAPTPPPPTPMGVVIFGTAGADLVSPTSTLSGQARPTDYADTIQGLAGHDTLDGGAGADSLVGGAGNDFYIVDDSGDRAFELPGEGVDLVRSSVDFVLGDNVENLTLTGAAVSGTGNELANLLVGNSAANFLYGMSGDDRLDGGAGLDFLDGGSGRDVYVGGAGKDIFYFERGEINGDTIVDFAKGDRIQFHGFSNRSTFEKAAGSATDWIVTDRATGQTELLHLSNGYALKGGDFLFG